MRNGKIAYLMNLLVVVTFIVVFVGYMGCGKHDNQVNENSDNASTHKVNGEDSDNVSEPGYEISYDEAGNKIFTLRKGVGHFSLVCPSGYELKSVSTEYVHVIFAKLYYGEGGNVEEASIISIGVQCAAGMPNAETYAKEDLNRSRSMPKFRLLDESMVMVAGAPGYQFSYFTVFSLPPPHDKLPPSQYIYRHVYFNHSGLFWGMNLNTDPLHAEQDNASFNLVLETFKVLN